MKAIGIGIRRTREQKTLDVLYPQIYFDQTDLFERLEKTFNINSTGFYKVNHVKLIEFIGQQNLTDCLDFVHPVLNTHHYYKQDIGIFALSSLEDEIQGVEDAYFRLQCLSQLYVKPHGIKLDGIFGILNNIAWSNQGPILVEDLSKEQTRARLNAENLNISHVDKFPFMVDYHIPQGVRVVSGSQVRLGAHLAPGTTVMPAGYVNFNAGTLGNAMIEGRVSAGVVVGNNTDVGGGASIMGTLSGGNKHVISIGEECLLGANSGTGISLGFGCTIAAGVYVTAAAKVWLYNENKEAIDIDGNVVEEGNNIVKGTELNGKEKLLFLLDSTNGHITCRPNPKTIELNHSLHKND